MYATRNMNRHPLLNCDHDDSGNNVIEEFYKENLQNLMQYPMPTIPSHILRDISVLLHHTLLFPSDWQGYASSLGVTDYLLLAKIQASAKASHDQEIYITLKMALQHKMFGHVIAVLLQEGRYDVLKTIQSDVKEFLESHSTTEVKKIASIQRQSLEYNVTDMTRIIKEFKSEKNCSVENVNHKNSYKVNAVTQNLSKEITLHQSPVDKDFIDAVHSLSVESQDENSVSCHEENSASPPVENTVEEIDLFPSAPVEERISVFIQHAETDTEFAKDLSRLLKDEGFIVRILSDMRSLVAMDNARGALTTMFQQVDFIIPIVSDKFLKLIHPNVYDRYTESADAKDNVFLYRLIMNEYMNNRCVNFRVRPVIVPKLNRQVLSNDIILSYSFRLWGEVPKLVRILKETKDLIPQYSQGN